MAQVVYSFSGQWMYFELIDTMAEPKGLEVGGFSPDGMGRDGKMQVTDPDNLPSSNIQKTMENHHIPWAIPL